MPRGFLKSEADGDPPEADADPPDAAGWTSEHLPLRRAVCRQPHHARHRTPSRRDPRRAAHHGRRGGRHLGDRQGVGHHVLRRPRPLRLPHRGVRSVRPRERPAARHLPQRHPLRGRDHRHDPGHAARRAPVTDAEPGGPGHLRRQRVSIAHAMLRLPRAGPGRRAHRTPQLGQARDRPSGLRQGLPPVRPRAAGRRRRPGHHLVDLADMAAADRRQHHRHHRLGLQLRLRHHRPHRRAGGARRSSAAWGCTSTAASAGSSCRGAAAGLRHPAVRLPRPRGHDHQRRHPQVRLRLQGHLGAGVSRPARCATASTSSSPTGPAASTARRAWTGHAPAACWRPPGRPW